MRIEEWNQPNGWGRGWALCSDAKAERFFVFDSDGVSVGRQFKTRREAGDYVSTLRLTASRTGARLTR